MPSRCIGSGDAGIYAMASPALEAADDTFDVDDVARRDRDAGRSRAARRPARP